MAYENIRVETQGRVGLITLNRPKALNALNEALVTELNLALDAFEANPEIGCLLLTGSEKAFAAGADIKLMQPLSYPSTYLEDFVAPWERIGRCRKPIVVAVAGFALGGGCELAMMCDIVIAADNAQFGQPTNLGFAVFLSGICLASANKKQTPLETETLEPASPARPRIARLSPRAAQLHHSSAAPRDSDDSPDW